MENKIFENARIFTSDDENLYADSMIVEEGKIAWIGRRAEMPSCSYERVDLNGACVIPGLIDAHMHPVMLADFSQQISALPPRVNSIAELIEEIRRVRKEKFADRQDGKWIEGWGYDEGKFAEQRALTRYDLDEGCSDMPVCIIRTCGHIRCVNSKALEIAGIDRNTPDPEGGEIERDADGEPTGVLKENARNLVTPFIPVPTREEKVENLIALGQLLLSQGIVGVTDMGNLDKGDNYPLYEEAAKRGWELKTGIYYMWDFFAEDKDFDLSGEKRDRDQQIFAAGLKLIGDGSVSGRTAWMSRPYLGRTEEYGLPVCSDELVESAVSFCKRKHCQLSVHAMGGKAIKRAVDRLCLEDDWMEGKENVPYARVEHITDPSEESIQKAAEKGIAFVTQPIFMYAEIESYLKNLGKEWMKECYPVKRMLDRKVQLCFSTDAPATSWAVPSDPFPCIKAAVTRRAWDGTDCGRDQAVDIQTAVKLYTRESAKAAGFPEMGQLKRGYRADFVVLDRNIFEIPEGEIDKIKVQKVFIKGKRVYEI